MMTEEEAMAGLPNDPVMAFAVLVSKCANGLLGELVESGKTETQARNAIVYYFLDFASGEACRIARSEGRTPDRDKWLKAVNGAFDKAFARTAVAPQT
jgi:hypothetical protein